MSSTKGCFSCRHWLPQEPNVARPQGWPKWERPSYWDETQRFTIRDLWNYCYWNKIHQRKTTVGWPGHCMLQPVSVEAGATHTCGQHSIHPDQVLQWRHLTAASENQAEIDRLKIDLRKARDLAGKRWLQLQGRKAREPSKPKRERNSHVASSEHAPVRSSRSDENRGSEP